MEARLAEIFLNQPAQGIPDKPEPGQGWSRKDRSFQSNRDEGFVATRASDFLILGYADSRVFHASPLTEKVIKSSLDLF
jgi:hypothetical protein